ncbi:MAG: hypothetical protein H6828_06975 [Planctomycetes bacterium]|nr:hypothetical protein [Planctomycetota bacterium]
MRPTSMLFLAAPALAATAAAQVVDGSIAGDPYGAARSIQTVETNFGDNFSELDAAYATVSGGKLYLALTGNLENNFNKLEIFLDTKAGGENVLSGVPGNDGANVMAGLTFDAGFEADYHVILRRGLGKFDVDFAELGTANVSSYFDVFVGSETGSGVTGVGPANASPIDVAFDGSNVAGVLGGINAADPVAAGAVQTGIELGIALADLGSTGTGIKICAFVNGSSHNYASNQFLGGLAAPQDNLGGDGAGNFTGLLNFDLNAFAGNQYFELGPQVPGTAYCNGDGSSVPCPCGNNNDGSAGIAGCATFSGPNCNAFAAGVTLRGTGSSSLAANDAVLQVANAQNNQPGLFFRADNAINGGGGVVFGDGLRCAGGNVVRLQIAPANASGQASTSVSISAGLVAGDVKRFQYWCRIPGCSPCGSSFTLSNGYEITFTP